MSIPLLSTRFLPVLEDEIARMNGAKEETEGPFTTKEAKRQAIASEEREREKERAKESALGLELLPKLTLLLSSLSALSKSSQIFVQDWRCKKTTCARLGQCYWLEKT